jgi:hypothetical protein
MHCGTLYCAELERTTTWLKLLLFTVYTGDESLIQQ